jgi:mono/diheme cytochrome c family protein
MLPLRGLRPYPPDGGALDSGPSQTPRMIYAHASDSRVCGRRSQDGNTEGASAPDHAAATAMPSFGADYTDAEIAAVANYAISHFGGKQGQVTAKVADARP